MCAGDRHIVWLQWGHDRAVVELLLVITMEFAYLRLQWGHDRAVVELDIPVWRPPRYVSFNGATTARSWN